MADYASALIQSLRGGSGDFGTDNPGVSFLANPTMASAPINFRRAPRAGMTNRPEVLQMPAYVPRPSAAGGDGGASFVPDRGLNFDLPVIDQPYVEPDPVEPDPIEESVAESFPVSEPGPIYTEELPPLEPVAEPFPVPDQTPPEYYDLPPLPEPDPAPAPDYDEISEGEIEVVPPGSGQPARDAIDGIGDITDVGDALDEWEWIEPDVPEVPPPDIPEGMDANVDFSDAEPLNLMFDDFDWMFDDFGKTWDFEGWLGGGGGGGLGGMLQYVQE